MLVNDPIADMLTRIRNALVAKHDSILVPALAPYSSNYELTENTSH